MLEEEEEDEPDFAIEYVECDGRWWRCEWSLLASSIAGCWPLPMCPRLAIRYGGLHGSSACCGGASLLVLGSTVDMFQRRRTVEVPLSVHRQSGGYCRYVAETGTHSVKLCKVVDNPVMAQRTFPLVPCSIPSCSLLIQWSSWLCRSCSSGARREGARGLQGCRSRRESDSQ